MYEHIFLVKHTHTHPKTHIETVSIKVKVRFQNPPRLNSCSVQLGVCHSRRFLLTHVENSTQAEIFYLGGKSPVCLLGQTFYQSSVSLSVKLGITTPTSHNYCRFNKSLSHTVGMQ